MNDDRPGKRFLGWQWLKLAVLVLILIAQLFIVWSNRVRYEQLRHQLEVLDKLQHQLDELNRSLPHHG